MTATGHAGFAPAGQDIVCAGISALFFATAEYLRQMTISGLLYGEPVLRLEPGNVKISCEPAAVAEEEAEHVFRLLETGCRQIAESYPNNVSVVSAT